MEKENYLGIYLTPEGLYGAVLSGESVRCFFIAAAAPIEPAGQSPLTALARQAMLQADNLDQTAVAVRCAMVNQFQHHSEFTDARQIDSTIRFDAEEVAAADASSLAITYEINSSDSSGSNVTIYTSNRQTLTDMLLDMQAAGLDPTVMEPDAVCLARAIEKAGTMDPQAVLVLLHEKTVYLVRQIQDGQSPYIRTLLIDEQGDLTQWLSRQIVITAASMPNGQQVNTVQMLSSDARIDASRLAALCGLQVNTVNLTQKLALELPSEYPQGHEGAFWIAVGAVQAFSGRVRRADFRRDFMPYQGRRRLIQKSLRVVSISLTIFFVVLGLHFQLKAFRMSRDVGRLRSKLVEDYKSSMYGKNPPATESISGRLRRELAIAKSRAEGKIDENAITSRLTYVLEAFNKTPASVQFNIEQLSISERTIVLRGDTGGRVQTREVLDAIKKHPRLKVNSETLSTSADRDRFNITLTISEP